MQPFVGRFESSSHRRSTPPMHWPLSVRRQESLPACSWLRSPDAIAGFRVQVHAPADPVPWVIEQAQNEQPETSRQIVVAVLNDLRYLLGDVYDPQRNCNAILGQQPANLVGLRRSR